MPQKDKQFGETIKQFCSFETNNFRSLGRLVRLEARYLTVECLIRFLFFFLFSNYGVQGPLVNCLRLNSLLQPL